MAKRGHSSMENIPLKPTAVPRDDKNCSPSHRNRRSPSDRNAVLRSESQGNRVRLQTGIAFTFDRIPQPELAGRASTGPSADECFAEHAEMLQSRFQAAADKS